MLLTVMAAEAVTILILLWLYVHKSRTMAQLLQGRALKRELDAMAAENDAAARAILERHRAALDRHSMREDQPEIVCPFCGFTTREASEADAHRNTCAARKDYERRTKQYSLTVRQKEKSC